MKTLAKVAWSEGILLSHQHFQQFERHIDMQRQIQAHALHPYYWGVTQLSLDKSQLSLGKLALESVQAIFADGTVLDAPAVDLLPEMIDIPPGTSHCDVYLAIPAKQEAIAEMDALHPDQPNTLRYSIDELEVDDTARLSEQTIQIGIAQLKPSLVLATQAASNLIYIPIARILLCDADQGVILDDDYIATGLDVNQLPVLKNMANECYALLYHRKQKLAEHVQIHKGKLFADLSDLLLLQLCNCATAKLEHYLKQPILHPEQLYQLMLSTLAELSTFISKAKTYEALPHYHHNDFTATFTPLMQQLRHTLSTVLDQPSVEIEISKNNSGHYVAVIEDKKLFTQGEFVLAVKADLNADQLQKCVIAQSKFGPIDKINELISSQVPGIQLTALPVAPPQVPYVAGMHYFMLDTNSDYWHQSKDSGGIAMQFVGDLPGLEVALWAIKQ